MSSRSLRRLAFGAYVEILREERAEVEFIERIRAFAFGNLLGFFFEEGFVLIAIGGGSGFFGDFVQDGIGHDLLIDHVPQFQTVQREYADHLHQSRRQNLLLRDAKTQFGCKPVHRTSSA